MRATHVRKARRDLGLCPHCRAVMRAGQRVCRIGQGGSWMHRACFLTRYRSNPTGENT